MILHPDNCLYRFTICLIPYCPLYPEQAALNVLQHRRVVIMPEIRQFVPRGKFFIADLEGHFSAMKKIGDVIHPASLDSVPFPASDYAIIKARHVQDRVGSLLGGIGIFMACPLEPGIIHMIITESVPRIIYHLNPTMEIG